MDFVKRKPTAKEFKKECLQGGSTQAMPMCIGFAANPHEQSGSKKSVDARLNPLFESFYILCDGYSRMNLQSIA